MTKLSTHLVEKPWGRETLPPPFDSGGRKVGEVWFEHPQGRALPLLAKYIFTSEALSVQVHPDDEAARARGLARGKSECWYILDAEPDARLALGLEREVGVEALRQAALDGSVEALLDWRPVKRGDLFYVPAVTIHAIGAGISLLEFQQNADVTYRLYDYGRPRELHLDDALAVARRGPAAAFKARGDILVDGPHFSLVRQGAAARLEDRLRWVLPLSGSVRAGGEVAEAGECLLVEPGVPAAFDGEALVGAEGGI
jgi:mannose-6-phosphate isomerase